MKQLTLNLRLFWEGALLSYIALFHWLRPVTYLASKIVMPLSQLVFFTLLGIYATSRDNAGFYAIGNAVQIAAISGIYGVTLSIGGDRWNGTLIYLFATPANRLFLFLGRAFMHILDGMIGVIIGLVWSALLLGVNFSHADMPALALTVLITTISTSGLGLLLGCLSLVTLNVMFINNTVYFLLLLFSGANIPLNTLPAWMQAISWGLPLTRGIASARAIVNGASLAEVAPLLAGELLIGLTYIFVGYVFFRWFEFQGKRRGTLEAF
jgi:ABC-2 type transport system permease protein